MNYRHVYHAGNFADVLKHSVLALCLDYLKRKEAPFRVIDAHAGIGVYDLSSAEAQKTGEWRGGIGKMIGAEAEPPPKPVAELLAPYLGVVTAMNDGALTMYPGSPELARRLIRPQDRLALNELHPEDHATLRARYGADARISIGADDAWMALKALLPPPERRGLALIDPPFEVKDEFADMARGLRAALKRFATGAYLFWYPIKDKPPVEAFHRELADDLPEKSLRIELYVRAPDTPLSLNGCGLLAINPPFTLEAQMKALLPFLAARLASGPGAGWLLTAPPRSAHTLPKAKPRTSERP